MNRGYLCAVANGRRPPGVRLRKALDLHYRRLSDMPVAVLAWKMRNRKETQSA
jgi:hypothetical protein